MWSSVRSELGEAEGDESERDYGEAYGDPLDAGGIAFADTLVRSYAAHREAVDALLSANVSGWSFTQMAQTDLNVLRLAVTEMTQTDNPPEVVIEMAVRLAKKFGGEESGRFVNGVLAKVYRSLRHTGAGTPVTGADGVAAVARVGSDEDGGVGGG